MHIGDLHEEANTWRTISSEISIRLFWWLVWKLADNKNQRGTSWLWEMSATYKTSPVKCKCSAQKFYIKLTKIPRNLTVCSTGSLLFARSTASITSGASLLPFIQMNWPGLNIMEFQSNLPRAHYCDCFAFPDHICWSSLVQALELT